MAPRLVELPGGFYKAKSVLAACQRQLNLYSEGNPAGSPTKFTDYQTPGTVTLIDPASALICRCAYRATNGELFEVVGTHVYFTDSSFVRHSLGAIANLTTPVSMSDNGTVVVIVDGSNAGYTIDLPGHAFNTIVDAAFYGSPRVSYSDTYFVFNRPGTTQWYLSPPNWNGVTAFDALDIADKVGGADNISTSITMKEDVWTIGLYTTQVWSNNGGVDFPFALVSGIFIEHGCQAVYSAGQTDLSIFWLTQDDDGFAMVVQGKDYAVTRVSTHAMEAEIMKYPNLTDAIGMIYQQEGHTFYVLTFPTADKTWVYDLASGLWHERAWIDSNGVEHRWRPNCLATAYGKTLAGDFENGKLYQVDLQTYTDAGDPITRRRGFPHLLNSGLEMSYRSFVAYMNAGSATGLLTTNEPLIMLRWSDNGGFSWSDPISLPAGATGQYSRQIVARQLGMGRDRVFELFWSANFDFSLLGAFIDADPAQA